MNHDDSAASFVDELAAEQAALGQLLGSLADDAWSSPTPAAGWDVRDSVSHLADTEEIAHDTAMGGPRSFAEETERLRRSGGVIQHGIARGRALAPSEVREWWSTASQRNRSGLRSLDPTTRVPWGIGMGWRAFVTARLMEHWAHGLDIHAAVGVQPTDSDRLEHVAWIGFNSLPYAFRVGKVTPPQGRTLRLELLSPSGVTWRLGPDDATDSIIGSAGAWCRRAVQRVDERAARSMLDVNGPLAELAIAQARAFL